MPPPEKKVKALVMGLLNGCFGKLDLKLSGLPASVNKFYTGNTVGPHCGSARVGKID